MRIGMMVDLYKPHVSGITNYISLNKLYLEKEGNEVHVFTFGDLDFADTETNIHRSPGMPLIDTGYYFSFRYRKDIKELLQSMDIVHVHHPFLSGRLALRYCRPGRIPVVFTNHTRYDIYAHAYLPLLPEELSDSFLQSYMVPFCSAVDLVISPSLGMAKILRQLGVSIPIKNVPNGVELSRYQASFGELRTELGFSSEDILLVYSGRLAPEKNLAFLIQSFIGVAETLSNTHLLIIGGGPEEERLQEITSRSPIKNQIHFIGQIPYEDLPRYLSICNIFVTSSLSEVHPLSLIEGMASGLPALGIHSVGVGDTIIDNVTGFLTRNDMASFTARMTQLCLDAQLRTRLSTESLIHSQKFNIENTTKQLITLYQGLVSTSKKYQKGISYRIRHVFRRFQK